MRQTEERPGRLIRWGVVSTVALAMLTGCSAETGGGETTTPPPTTSAAPSSPLGGSQPFESVEAGTGLVWADEFEDDSPDRWKTWKRMEGARGWGNEELQNYTTSAQNSFVADGFLHIVVRKESSEDAEGNRSDYTSARLMTYETFRYGRVEARINVPSGYGLWSAFWMLGTEHTPGAPWASSGELDMMEYVDKAMTLQSAAIGVDTEDNPWNWVVTRPDEEGGWSGQWHVYAVDWSPDSITYSVDGSELGTLRKSELEEGDLWTFDNPSHIIVNVAVGGRWPSDDIEDAVLPAAMLVDYVRVYDSELRTVPESWMPKPP